MDTIFVYAPQNSNRLRFVLDWLLLERMHVRYEVVSQVAALAGHQYVLAYGAVIDGALSLPDAGLLWQIGIRNLTPEAGFWNEDLPSFFNTADTGYTIPFDLFSALFFLLSRYEEYNTKAVDKHGRFPAVSSLQYRYGWLQRPLADEWVLELRKLMNYMFKLNLQPGTFSFQPTYDIDMAYSHLHKGFRRIAGAYVRALMKLDVGQISERTKVLKMRQKDPYDSFRWLRQMHKEYDCKPLYFILSASRTTAFDKNIPPEHPAMMRVIRNIVRDGIVGIHPSYYSDTGDKMAAEKKMLEQVSATTITISRQHYIRVRTPATYRLLIKNGITSDYSMGYGSHLGFRAGTGSAFWWYDLEQEVITSLRIHPFCFMDTTAHFEAGLSPAAAMSQLEAMSSLLQKTGSTLITVFHNFSLGTAAEWKGWRPAYEQFMQDKAGLMQQH